MQIICANDSARSNPATPTKPSQNRGWFRRSIVVARLVTLLAVLVLVLGMAAAAIPFESNDRADQATRFVSPPVTRPPGTSVPTGDALEFHPVQVDKTWSPVEPPPPWPANVIVNRYGEPEYREEPSHGPAGGGVAARIGTG